MTFDVVILTYNSEKKIKNLLERIKNQNIKPQKIIIIDSNSLDNTVSIAKNYDCEVYIVDSDKFDHGGTRTYAAKIANSDIIVFFTDDALPYDNCSLGKLIGAFKDEMLGVAFGRQVPYENTNIFGKHLRFFNYPEKSYIRTYDDRKKYGIKTPFLSNSFCAYRKSVLEEIGFFKDNLILGEDTYAGAKILKAGYKIGYCADACVYHSHNYSAIDEFKRYFDIGAFHKSEKWILDDFGKAEGEGIKYIFSGIKYLRSEHKIYLLPEFFIRIFFKYMGYTLGYNHKLLPLFLIKLLSMHKIWWNKNRKN